MLMNDIYYLKLIEIVNILIEIIFHLHKNE